MGNRAIIIPPHETTAKMVPAIYVHWNGGMDSILSFIDALNKHARPNDTSYAAARLVQLIANFMGGNLSIGLWAIENTAEAFAEAAEENGTYVIGMTDQGRYFLSARYTDSGPQTAADLHRDINEVPTTELFGDQVYAKTVAMAKA